MGLARDSAAFVWEDRALFVGDRSETSFHSHHATELSIALDDRGIDMDAPGAAPMRGVCGAMVRAGAEHRLAIPGPKVAVLYLDPQSRVAASLHQWLGERDVRPLDETVMTAFRPRFRGFLERRDAGLSDAGTLCAALVSQFAEEAPRQTMDHRVRRAKEALDGRLDTPPSLEELAMLVGISPSRMRHMFVEQVGLPMRRYVLWMRLRKALVEALEGASMAESAQAAGFSDAAHFSRTCRQMFGLPPTAFTPVDNVFVE